MRYAGVRYEYHLAAVEDEHERYVAKYEVNLRLRFVQQERDLEGPWEAQ